MSNRHATHDFGAFGIGPPYEAQRRFLFSEKKNVLFCAGRGTGKTTIGVLRLLLMALDPRCSGESVGLFAPTYRSLSRIHEVILQGYLESWERATGWSLLKRHRKADHVYELVNGCMIFCQSFERADRIRGYSLAAALIDEIEVASDPNYVYSIIAAAVRATGDVPLSIAITTTPKGYRGTIKSHLEAIRAGNEDFQLITCPTSDNPYLPPSFLERLKATLSKALYAQEVEGRILRPSSTVYPEFSRNRHVVKYRHSNETPYNLAIDWGYSHPAVLWVAKLQTPNEPDRDVVFDEFVSDDIPEQALIDIIRKKCAALGRDPDLIVGDRAVPRQNQAMIRTFRSSRTRTLESKHEQQIWRGVEILRSRLDPLDGNPRLFFSDSLLQGAPERGIIRSMEALRRKTRDSEVVDEIFKDNVHDHSCDAIRMLMVALYKRSEAAFTTDAKPGTYADRFRRR